MSDPDDSLPQAAEPTAPAEAEPTVPAPEPVAEATPPDATELTPAELRMAVEGVLFVSPKAVPMSRLLDTLPGTDEDHLRGLLHGLKDRWRREGRGWDLCEIAGGWQLLTRPEVHPWVRRFEKRALPDKLTRSALETLAVVAYKQPVTRGAIEDVRGVQCGPVLRQLMDLKLVQVVGRDDNALGRPLLYGTTEQFLSRFGLARVDDLPKSHEFGAS
ncbi:MAG: SMC-Scp complex subunit ScpB [Planctomycetes bacterium]|nr:SMC-Scp complex subunit ScpB [Planctomycetota bacterium]